jgi:hypothetical protein
MLRGRATPLMPRRLPLQRPRLPLRLLPLLLLLLLLRPGRAAPAAQCGAAYMDAASAELHALQHPADCGSARLLVLEVDPSNFEGLGSVLVGVAEGLAEAHAAQRTLVLGPQPATAPHVLRGAQCVDAAGWECTFQPVGACTWAAVAPAEAAALAGFADSCSARVKTSTPTRGAPTLYSSPPSLRGLLPPRTAPAAEAECWAAAVFAAAVRLQPGVADRLRARQEALFPGGAPYAAAHLRVGDNALEAEQFRGRVYTNKPVLSARALGAALRAAVAPAGGDGAGGAADAQPLPIYLATDAADAEAAAAALGAAAGGAPVTLLPRFRTPHGSHTAAFAPTMARERMLLPFEHWLGYVSPGGRYAGDAAEQTAQSDQAAVRDEALEDLFLLSGAVALAGSAASHYSVAAYLWSLSRGAAAAPATWVDAADVASGLLATGFMHGQTNTTFALHHPEQRALKATSSWLDWRLSEGETPITFHPTRCVPLVPRRPMRRMRAAWACAPGAERADAYVARCVARIRAAAGDARAAADVAATLAAGAPAAEPCATLADLINEGATFFEQHNVELALACWRAVPDLPHADEPVGGADSGEDSLAEIARGNLQALLHKRAKLLASYTAAAQPPPAALALGKGVSG